MVSAEDAREYSESLGQIGEGWWRQIAWAYRQQIPEALGMSRRDWAQAYHGYLQMSVEERREAARELTAEPEDGGMGMTQREAADVLGVDQKTVSNDTRPHREENSSREPAEDLSDLQGVDAREENSSSDLDRADPWVVGKADDDDDRPANSQLIQQSDENDWHTPARYVKAAQAVLRKIDLDPASSPAANANIGAAKIFTEKDDGLHQSWHGRIWLNPPYGRKAGDFALRLCEEYVHGNIESAILLVNAHCTDTAWFQPLWQHTLCFTDHRIDFDSGGRSKNTSSTHGSVFVYLGAEPERFAVEFAAFGAVVRKFDGKPSLGLRDEGMLQGSTSGLEHF